MDTTDDIKQAASAMGKKGGKRGGPARAAAMTRGGAGIGATCSDHPLEQIPE